MIDTKELRRLLAEVQANFLTAREDLKPAPNVMVKAP